MRPGADRRSIRSTTPKVTRPHRSCGSDELTADCLRWWWTFDRALNQGAAVSQDYHTHPRVADALNPEQYRVTQGTATERSGVETTSHAPEYERAHQWREATRELVLADATAMAAADPPQSQCSISITLTGNALSNDVLLADTGIIVLTALRDRADVGSHPMRVVPMRLDVLSDLPAVHVLGRGVTEATRLRLVVELTARNPRTNTTSVMRCAYDSVLLDVQTPLAVLDFQIQHDEPRFERPPV
jgi:hypothetical protein